MLTCRQALLTQEEKRRVSDCDATHGRCAGPGRFGFITTPGGRASRPRFFFSRRSVGWGGGGAPPQSPAHTRAHTPPPPSRACVGRRHPRAVNRAAAMRACPTVPPFTLSVSGVSCRVKAEMFSLSCSSELAPMMTDPMYCAQQQRQARRRESQDDTPGERCPVVPTTGSACARHGAHGRWEGAAPAHPARGGPGLRQLRQREPLLLGHYGVLARGVQHLAGVVPRLEPAAANSGSSRRRGRRTHHVRARGGKLDTNARPSMAAGDGETGGLPHPRHAIRVPLAPPRAQARPAPPTDAETWPTLTWDRGGAARWRAAPRRGTCPSALRPPRRRRPAG